MSCSYQFSYFDTLFMFCILIIPSWWSVWRMITPDSHIKSCLNFIKIILICRPYFFSFNKKLLCIVKCIHMTVRMMSYNLNIFDVPDLQRWTKIGDTWQQKSDSFVSVRPLHVLDIYQLLESTLLSGGLCWLLHGYKKNQRPDS